ncbi:MAG: 23S rRNA (guanosine(2251)-2'-O)-methyltransferase RlmB [Rhodospirillales bacterium CG15_BIG_FIL_POST_REV_8_21_14_020_66_15]|nr:MAG: 23S rRNA (guanosine(2251)-2'-O)-methyltransferase RlmB [Rhodospirillales bacterium CG15_BIG_FIL_POST_REV_8_21_14_020_66_15]
MLNRLMSKRKPPHKGRFRPKPEDGSSPRGGLRAAWIYGRHAVLAAIANHERAISRIVAAPGQAEEVAAALRAKGAPSARPQAETLGRREIDALLPQGAVHQGMAVLAPPLAQQAVEDVCARARPLDGALVLVLDQATDPHNIGAILRSAAAFGAMAVIVQDRNAPEATGALAKAASGALETVPLVVATNLSRALEHLKDAGFWCLGLDGEAPGLIGDADLSGRIALVLGAEGAGLRRLVKEHCDLLVRIPIHPAMESLNLSNAAAVALYEAARRRPGLPDGKR